MPEPYYADDMVTVHVGDCRKVLPLVLGDNSVDTICCDPPYELAFMGRGWDMSGVAFDPVTWAECWGHLSPDLTPCHDNRCGCCPHPGRRMVNGRLHAGRCQPEQASRERAHRDARAHAEWWRTGSWPGTSTEVIEQVGLFEVAP